MIRPASEGVGSIDMGNVSHAVPAIHPWIGIGDPSLIIHSKEFADYTVTKQGEAAIKKGAYALAATAYDVIVSKEIREKIRAEFEAATR